MLLVPSVESFQKRSKVSYYLCCLVIRDYDYDAGNTDNLNVAKSI
jgi:hypothetical protein